ncbi:hypothetical protein E2562_009636 [Oryza meyeriana var. granulata]|uniref:Uncharacterized protein n=1 Tax=Oryza meyeriana var. granulata TaxID=110450 RepID=A0A6G1D1H3_9ORYZ|nr:hypothetical protein E2562_009636 [Oryza meyeriana var. granulata]
MRCNGCCSLRGGGMVAVASSSVPARGAEDAVAMVVALSEPTGPEAAAMASNLPGPGTSATAASDGEIDRRAGSIFFRALGP